MLGSAGVIVIDSKRYRGWFCPGVEKLSVRGRDQTALVEGVHRQVELVRGTVGEVPVRGVVCFVDAD